MRRKSERNKSKTAAEKKPAESAPRKTRRQSRRRKRSSSHSSSDESDDAPLKPAVVETKEPEISPPSDEPKISESRSNSDEDKQEQPIWKVKTTEAPSGEIQKLKICLQRPPLTPERTEKSPRRRRGKASSQSDDASLTPEEKPQTHKRKTRRSSPVSQTGEGSSMDNSLIEAAEKDECLIIIKETNEVMIGKGKLDCSQTSQESENEECIQDSRTEVQPDESLIEIKQDLEQTTDSATVLKDLDDPQNTLQAEEIVIEKEIGKNIEIIEEKDIENNKTETLEESIVQEINETMQVDETIQTIEVENAVQSVEKEINIASEEVNEQKQESVEKEIELTPHTSEPLPNETTEKEDCEEAQVIEKHEVFIEEQNDISDAIPKEINDKPIDDIKEDITNEEIVQNEEHKQNDESTQIKQDMEIKDVQIPEKIQNEKNIKDEDTVIPDSIKEVESIQESETQEEKSENRTESFEMKNEESLNDENIQITKTPKEEEKSEDKTESCEMKNKELLNDENIKQITKTVKEEEKSEDKTESCEMKNEESSNDENIIQITKTPKKEEKSEDKTESCEMKNKESLNDENIKQITKTPKKEEKSEDKTESCEMKNKESFKDENIIQITKTVEDKLEESIEETKDLSTQDENTINENVNKDKPSPEKEVLNDKISETKQMDSKPQSPETKVLSPEEKCHSAPSPIEEDVSERITPKRKWSTFNISHPVHERITSETIISLYPSLKMLSIDEIKLEAEEIVKEQKIIKKEREVIIQHPVSPREEDPEKEVSNIGLNRKISIVDDEASKLQPPPSPAKNPVSSILYITNLVRPFTLKQLQELLSRTGKIIEDGFWTDKIKSKCYVQYETEDEAEATRNALHGVQWPTGNGKKLIIDFGTTESMAAARNAVVESAKIVPEKVVEKVPEYEKKEIVTDNRWEKTRTNVPVREWDLGKVPQDQRDHSRSREKATARSDRERSDKKRQARNESPSNGDHVTSRKKKKPDSEVKMMDDLFHKTKATPSIYWLPLSPEQIAKKQQQRLQRMAEHKRRMEESRRMERDFVGRGAPRSRRRSGRFDGD